MNRESSYHRLMQYVRVTPDMEKRILETLSNSKTPRFISSRWIKLGATAACIMLLVLAATTIPKWEPQNTPAPSPPVYTGSPVSGYQDYQSLSESLPFDLLIPSVLPEGYQLQRLNNLFGSTAELIYTNNDATLKYRMAEGSQDISGDYNQYSDEKMAAVSQSASAALSGAGGLYQKAVWTDGGYTFSLTSSAGLSQEEIIDLIRHVKPYTSSN